MQDQLKDQFYDVISGKSQVRFGTIIHTNSSYSSNGEKTSGEIEGSKQFKEQEEKRLITFISENSLWISDIDFSQYVSEGAEQRVYLKDSDHVIKLNDSIYYASWKDYLYN